MFNRYVLWAIFALSFFLNEAVVAQSSNDTGYPVVGKPCPDFSFHNIEDFDKKSITLNQLKGKPFILDFFSTGCTSCFISFKEINVLSQTFAGRVQFLLVGYDDKYIRPAFNTFKKREHLIIPHAYDTSTFTKFNIFGVPYILCVNAEGIVTAITNTPLTEPDLSAFVEGKSFPFRDATKIRLEIPAFDYHKPFLVAGNGGNDSIFLQRSLFSAWKMEMGNFTFNSVDYYARLNVPLQIIGWPLSSLYKFAYTNRIADWTAEDTAYYGKYHYAPVYEMKDSSEFQSYDDSEHNIFCYSQIVPKAHALPEEMLRIMKEDLHNCFGYEASIETRKMPYLRLILSDSKNNSLRSKGGEIIEEPLMGGIHLQNSTIRQLINFVSYKAYLVPKDLPLLDETGIEYPIDIQFEAMMTDFNDVKKELHNYGLEIIPGYKYMKVLVIRDKN